jgi:hypothetical protein
MEKIIKTAKGIDKALSILWVILITVSAIAVIALLIGVIFAGEIAEWDAFRSEGTATLTSGILKIEVDSLVLTEENFRALCGSMILVIVMACALSLYTIRLFRGIMSEMKEGRPFSEAMPARIGRMAVVIFLYALIAPLFPVIPTFYFYRMYDISATLSGLPSRAVAVSFEYNVNILGLIAGIIVLLLSMVFEYGARLQRESDEML